MKDWYLRQSHRDQMIVVAVAALTLIALLYALIWYPVSSSLAQTRQAIVTKQETLQFIQQAAVQLRSAGGGASQRLESDRAPYLLIDQVIREAALEPPERIEPSGSDGNGARVQFDEVEFDRLVSVLAQLELYGLKVTTMTISRRNQGTVSARFNMERS